MKIDTHWRQNKRDSACCAATGSVSCLNRYQDKRKGSTAGSKMLDNVIRRHRSEAGAEMTNTLNNATVWKGFSNSTWHWKWWAFFPSMNLFFFHFLWSLIMSYHQYDAKTSIQIHPQNVKIELQPVVPSGGVHLSQALTEQFLAEGDRLLFIAINMACRQVEKGYISVRTAAG